MDDEPVRRQACLQSIPSVEELLQSDPLKVLQENASRQEIVSAVRTVLDRFRQTILHAPKDDLPGLPQDRSGWIQSIHREVSWLLVPSLRPVINATGVIIHTNLGRSILASEALKAMEAVASSYSNLEFDLQAGRRGSRYVHVESLLCRLTGAESALVVNNNAGAVLLSLSALANGKEVVVSRGELVEIGGSFRMPDVMEQSGARLVEVGSTNKTHLKDYAGAIGPETALLLKVHTSNYRILGFTKDISVRELVELGRRSGIPVMEDLGSGCLVDLQRWGIEPEPLVQDSVRHGADLVTFSGDKLLGGPQAGVILGKRALVEGIRRHPLHRALRIDKMTLAALEATLRLYWDPAEAVDRIPTLRMLALGEKTARNRARRLARRIRQKALQGMRVRVRASRSQVGGGALPLLALPTWVVGIRLDGVSAARLEKTLRMGDPPVVARIEREEVVLDVRTVQDSEIASLAQIAVHAGGMLLGSEGREAER